MYGIKIENNTLTILEGDANTLLNKGVFVSNIRETKEEIDFVKSLMTRKAERTGKFFDYSDFEISEVVFGVKVENNQVIIEKGDANSLLEKGYNIRNLCSTEDAANLKKKTLNQLCK